MRNPSLLLQMQCKIHHLRAVTEAEVEPTDHHFSAENHHFSAENHHFSAESHHLSGHVHHPDRLLLVVKYFWVTRHGSVVGTFAEAANPFIVSKWSKDDAHFHFKW